MNNSTRHKLNEANYFLDNMRKTYDDDAFFSFNLSAFLSAARSITLHMQKQYKSKENFNDWYEKQREKMQEDSELKHLISARNEDVHVEKMEIKECGEVTESFDGKLTIINSRDSIPLKNNQVEIPQNRQKRTIKRRYFKKYPNIDIIVFSENQLTKYEKLVMECETIFL